MMSVTASIWKHVSSTFPHILEPDAHTQTPSQRLTGPGKERCSHLSLPSPPLSSPPSLPLSLPPLSFLLKDLPICANSQVHSVHLPRLPCASLPQGQLYLRIDISCQTICEKRGSCVFIIWSALVIIHRFHADSRSKNSSLLCYFM